MSPAPSPCYLHAVCAVSSTATLEAHLLQSHDALRTWTELRTVHQASSAAAAFNPVLEELSHREEAAHRWVLWVHQDVRLPEGWVAQFLAALQAAQERWPLLRVAGIYGLTEWGDAARRAGALWDRGTWMEEPTDLPCLASSLDEVLVAVRADSGLRWDPALGFDLYATDVCLQAREAGQLAAVLRAPCFHGSSTPRQGELPTTVWQRIAQSAEHFERKWSHVLPVFTPCFEIRRPGDVHAFLQAHFTPTP